MTYLLSLSVKGDRARRACAGTSTKSDAADTHKGGKEKKAGKEPVGRAHTKPVGGAARELEFKSVLHLCGRALPATDSEGCNCLAFAIHGELRRINEQHGVTWPAGFPKNALEVRRYLWDIVLADAKYWAPLLRAHCPQLDSVLQPDEYGTHVSVCVCVCECE